jgi:hypothetical protein
VEFAKSAKEKSKRVNKNWKFGQKKFLKTLKKDAGDVGVGEQGECIIRKFTVRCSSSAFRRLPPLPGVFQD